MRDESEHYLFLYLVFLPTYHFHFLDFPERDTLVFRNTEHKSPLGHVTDTACRPDITAALEGHWKDGAVHWPFICLAGETASAGESRADHISTTCFWLDPTSTLPKGSHSFLGFAAKVQYTAIRCHDQDLNKLLYPFIYRLYKPGHFADPSYIKTEFDEETTARYTIKIAYPGGTKECPGFYSIYATVCTSCERISARYLFATRTHVLSNPDFKFEELIF